VRSPFFLYTSRHLFFPSVWLSPFCLKPNLQFVSYTKSYGLPEVAAMKGHGVAVIGGLLSTVVLAERPNGVVQWEIQKRQTSAPDLTRLRKRASTYTQLITNQEARGGYFASCRLGTPAQDIVLQLDTGSSDIWVPDSRARVCTKAGTEGCSLGSCMPEVLGIPFARFY
jgi:Eukaryotic aspartyl protease